MANLYTIAFEVLSPSGCPGGPHEWFRQEKGKKTPKQMSAKTLHMTAKYPP